MVFVIGQKNDITIINIAEKYLSLLIKLA